VVGDAPFRRPDWNSEQTVIKGFFTVDGPTVLTVVRVGFVRDALSRAGAQVERASTSVAKRSPRVDRDRQDGSCLTEIDADRAETVGGADLCDMGCAPCAS